MANLVSKRAVFTGMFAGRGYIAGEEAGIVSVAGQPAQRQILLFDRQSMQLVRSTWSDSAGHYRLPKLDPTRLYLIMALDHKGQYEPVAYDGVQPFVA